jgi:flagellar motor component MotA
MVQILNVQTYDKFLMNTAVNPLINKYCFQQVSDMLQQQIQIPSEFKHLSKKESILRLEDINLHSVESFLVRVLKLIV